MADHVRTHRGRLTATPNPLSLSHQETDNSNSSTMLEPAESPSPSIYSPSVHNNALPSATKLKPGDTIECAKLSDIKNTYNGPAHLGSSQMTKINLLDASRMLVSEDTALQLDLHTVDLAPLWEASIDPPITASTLAELDLGRISVDPRLCHDLNFEYEVAFRPNYDGERGRRKKALAKQYWAALAFELSLFMGRGLHSNSISLLDHLAARSFQWRLPRMFEAVKEILSTLVRGEHVLDIEQNLDTELLMQQLSKGVCDFISFSAWLSTLLKGSCSPDRDMYVMRVSKQIQQSVTSNDPVALCQGIEDMFGLLETMKLDVANNQIRNLRHYMVNESTRCEQRYFSDRVSQGLLDVEGSKDWYYKTVPQQNTIDLIAGDCKQYELASRVLELVVNPPDELVPTFVYDRDRLRTLNHDYQVVFFQKVIRAAFERLLRNLGSNAKLTTESMQKLTYRVCRVQPNLLSKEPRRLPLDTIILEITRTAYEFCGISILPQDLHLLHVKHSIDEAMSGGSVLHHHLEQGLLEELELNLQWEVNTIRGMSPLQMSYHLNPKPYSNPADQDLLRSLVQRVAHISVLHWRVWSPTFYPGCHG